MLNYLNLPTNIEFQTHKKDEFQNLLPMIITYLIVHPISLKYIKCLFLS